MSVDFFNIILTKININAKQMYSVLACQVQKLRSAESEMEIAIDRYMYSTINSERPKQHFISFTRIRQFVIDETL